MKDLDHQAPDFEALVRIRSPRKYNLQIPANIVYEFIDEVRKRIDRGLRIAEEHAKLGHQGSTDSDVGPVITRLRERYRETLRQGIIDSREDMDVLLLAYELDGILVAADEGLRTWADKVGVKIISGDYGSDSAAVAYDAIAHAKSKYVDVVLIDTSGRMAINKDLMEEMKKIKRVTNPDYTILVVDALAGNDATKQASDFHASISLDGVILSKMDADARGGALISVTHATAGVPILYIGTGQKYTNLEKFAPDDFVRKILK